MSSTNIQPVGFVVGNFISLGIDIQAFVDSTTSRNKTADVIVVAPLPVLHILQGQTTLNTGTQLTIEHYANQLDDCLIHITHSTNHFSVKSSDLLSRTRPTDDLLPPSASSRQQQGAAAKTFRNSSSYTLKDAIDIAQEAEIECCLTVTVPFHVIYVGSGEVVLLSENDEIVLMGFDKEKGHFHISTGSEGLDEEEDLIITDGIALELHTCPADDILDRLNSLESRAPSLTDSADEVEVSMSSGTEGQQSYDDEPFCEDNY